MTRRFTGYHMAAILVVFFGIVMAVNFLMAGFARSSFGGVVVENSYVASQKFNGWLDRAEAQDRLGWTIETRWLGDRRLSVVASGPGPAASLGAVARHPLGRFPDYEVHFDRQPDGSFLSREPLAEGRWILRMELVDGADRWRREEHLQ